jgi:hypothetical protein
MSTQPSEHAMRAAGELLGLALKTLVAGNGMPDGMPDGIGLEASRIIDTHAVEPATRELREALARIQGLTMSQVRDVAEGFQLCREIAARALSENEEKK